MRPPGFFFAVSVFIAVIGLAVLGAWLALSESESGPLRVKVLKVSQVTPYPGAGATDSTPHEKLELELMNKSAHSVRYTNLILRSDASPGKVLATDGGTPRSWKPLDPGDSVRLIFIAYDRHRTGREWHTWQPRLFYHWEYGGKPLRMRIRQWYNERARHCN